MVDLRYIVGLSLCALLAGCSTAQQTGSAERGPQEAVAADPEPAAEPEALPPADAPPPKPDAMPESMAALPEGDPDDLLKLDTAETASILGAPDRTEDQAPALIWVYEVPNLCTLRLFFYPELDGTRFLALTYAIEPATDSAGEHACVTAVRRAHAS
ncbi:MAG: hypothetical protein WD044_04810 [Dongiaceae bacterium]